MTKITARSIPPLQISPSNDTVISPLTWSLAANTASNPEEEVYRPRQRTTQEILDLLRRK